MSTPRQQFAKRLLSEGVAAPLEPTAPKPISPITPEEFIKQWDSGFQRGTRSFSYWMQFAEAYAAAVSKNLREELARSISSRKHTQDWYAAHYGKLEDWARKRLPEPWVNEFFSCIANGTWGHDDVGPAYRCQAGFDVVPSGYVKFDSAQEQILHDQSERAETAESRILGLEKEITALRLELYSRDRQVKGLTEDAVRLIEQAGDTVGPKVP